MCLDDLDQWAHQQRLEQQEWEETDAMKIHDMMPSKYLKKEDVGKGVLVTIKGISRANLAMDGEPADFNYLLHFEELEKPLVLKSTNMHLCAQACGSEETDEWPGKKIVLYTDPNVSMRGKIVGGVRIRAPRPGTVVQASPAAPSASAPPTMPYQNQNETDDDIPW